MKFQRWMDSLRSRRTRSSGPTASASPLVPIAFAVACAVVVRFFILDAAIVEGKSMLPHYRNGQVVLVVRAFYGLRFGNQYLVRWNHPQAGQVIAARRPDTGVPVIKRIAEVLEEGNTLTLFLLGDNAIESVDSRQFGPVRLDDVLGIIVPRR